MDTTEGTLLSLETMGQSVLSAIARKLGGLSARSLEHQQKRAWPMAPIENLGVIASSAGEDFCTNRAARFGGAAGMNHRTAVYVICMPGGVGGGGAVRLLPVPIFDGGDHLKDHLKLKYSFQMLAKESLPDNDPSFKQF